MGPDGDGAERRGEDFRENRKIIFHSRSVQVLLDGGDVVGDSMVRGCG